MDPCLPADFRELHDATTEDWRDVSSSNRVPRLQPTPVEPRDEGHAIGPADACADPLWRVI